MVVGDSQTGEQWYQRSSPTAVKILSPTSGFPAWGSRKSTGNPQETWPWRPAGFDDRTSTRLRETETPLSKAQTKLVCTKTQQKGAVPPLQTEPVSSVQLLSRVWLLATPWITARQASLSITNSRSSLRLTSIESVMSSSPLILCHTLLLLTPIPPSIRVFSNESTLHMRWPKYWSFSFSIIPFREIPGLISFRMDWLDLLAVQGTLKSLLQHHSSKASILRHSAFFTVQLSHPYMTTGKTIALTRQTFVGKVMSLLLNMLSRLVIIFLPRSKRLLISWLQSPSAVILEPQK